MQNTRLPEATQEKLPTTDRAMVRYLHEGLIHGYRAIASVINTLHGAEEDKDAQKAALMSLVVMGATYAEAADGVDAYLAGVESKLPAKYFAEQPKLQLPKDALVVPGNRSIN